jgi:hypothetical protein
VTELGSHVRILNGADRHLVKHLGILSNLVLLKPVDCELTLVDRYEVDQLPILFDLNVGLFDAGL